MYYAGVPTLVVRAKWPALISINGRVAGECGGEGYISVPLSAKPENVREIARRVEKYRHCY